MKTDDSDPTDVLDAAERLLSDLDAWDPDEPEMAVQRTAMQHGLERFANTVRQARFKVDSKYAVDFPDRHWELTVFRVHDGSVHARLHDAHDHPTGEAVRFCVEDPTHVQPLT